MYVSEFGRRSLEASNTMLGFALPESRPWNLERDDVECEDGSTEIPNPADGEGTEAEHIYIYIYIYIHIHIYIYIYIWNMPRTQARPAHEQGGPSSGENREYGQFSKCHVCFCGLDPGNLKFETVRTHKQHTYFLGFETLNLKFCD